MNIPSIFKHLNSSLIVAASLAVPTAAIAGTEVTTLTNKEKAVALISSIETGDRQAASYINPKQYTQHNQAVADGIEGFAAVLQQLPAGSAKANVVRALQDGDYVVLHTEYDFFGPKAGFDVFRFENDLIVEHWDNLQKVAPANASGRTQFDGATEIIDNEKTESNKSVIANFVQSILIDGDMSQMASFIGPNDSDYLQHNPGVSDGLSGLGKALAQLAEQGMPMSYSKNHNILGEGNFVLSISEGEFLKQHVAFYDLFRLDNGLIVEHWDTIENIPAAADAANNNGKFGFK